MKNSFKKVFLYEIKKFINNTRLLIWVLGVPLLIFLFWGVLFESGTPHDLPVAVIDYDNTYMSREVTRMLDAAPYIKIQKKINDLTEGERLLQINDIYALVVIPNNFQKDTYKNKSTDVICYTNSQFLLPSALIQKDFSITISTFAAGVGIKRDLAHGKSKQQAYNNTLPTRADAHVLYNPYSNYNYYLNLSLFPMMFQMVVMIISIYVLSLIMKRHKAQALYRMSGRSLIYTILGKILPYSLLFFFMGWVMNMLLFKYIGIPTKANMTQMMIITSLLILAWQGLAIFFVSNMGSMRLSLTIGGGFAAISFSFSGYTFPTDGFPELVKYVAQLFPYTPFLKTYINTAIRNFDYVYSAKYYFQMLIYIGIGLLSLPKFKKLIINNGYKDEKK